MFFYSKEFCEWKMPSRIPSKEHDKRISFHSHTNVVYLIQLHGKKNMQNTKMNLSASSDPVAAAANRNLFHPCHGNAILPLTLTWDALSPPMLRHGRWRYKIRLAFITRHKFSSLHIQSCSMYSGGNYKKK